MDFAWQSDGSIHFMNFFPSYHNFDTENADYFVPLNEWTHIAFSRDVGINRNVYINGELLMTVEDDGDNIELPSPVLYCTENYVDRFCIWNYARSSVEILGDMNLSLEGSENGLVGYWSFNEGSGTTAYDHTANENNGTISGATWSTDVPFTNVSGCTDLEACNYDPEASADDGSCVYEYDCAGTCGGDLEPDCCGVCGGDNSQCSNCCGMPFPDDCSEACYEDYCGVCDDIPENDCVQDCAGIWGGDAVVDECGVCDGDNTSCDNSVINVTTNTNYETIQEAIDAANPGDEILVNDGTYPENLLIEKDLFLNSVNGYDVTIIDGSQGRSLGSTIVIRPESNSTHKPVVEINGFKIINGKGTDVVNKTITLADGTHPVQKVGGGLFVYVNSPKVNNCKFLNNGNYDTYNGGAGFVVSSSSDIDFNDRPDYQDHPALLPAEGILDFSNNTFLGNAASQGHSVYILGDDYDEVNMAGDSLDVFSTDYESASEYWVVSDYDIDYNNATGEAEAILNDVWVDPVNGIDEGNIIGDENNPFLTIDYAMSMIYPTTENPITIHLTADTFSSSTEHFPIILKSNINLIGQGEGVTILDAGQTDRVITMENCENNILSGLTITGGDRNPGSGGGMVLINSDPLITDIAIQENSAEDSGGGIYLINSNPTLVNITIDNNDAYGGGGITFNNSSPIIKDAIISNNFAYSGGGLDIFNLSAPILSQVIIAGNSSYSIGGGIYFRGSKAIFDHVLIYDNTAYIGGGLYIVVYGDDNPIFNHVTISNNSVEGPSESGGIFLDGSICTEDSYCPKIINSIIYNNSGQSIVGNSAVITYSNVSGGYEGIGNIDSNPYFNGDFSLQDSSPCIDAGHPNQIYKDLDLSRADMGFTGGSYLLPTFTEYDFGEVGTTVITENWYLYNFRNTNLSINSASFQTQSFYTDINFPLIIESLDKAIIPINAISLSTGVITDNMVISGPDIPNGSFVDLVMTAVGENVLSGNLSGQLPAATYRITGNLTVDAGETLYISPGTTFLFDGEYSFTVYGILKAQGNEQDSIIFSNYNLNTPNKWKGITLQNVTEETVLQYVRISGAFSDSPGEGGGIDLQYSHPILTNITISGNISHVGGGIGGWFSNPTIIDAVIRDNSACRGGGIFLENAEGAQLIRSLIVNNSAFPVNGSCSPNDGGGLYITGPISGSNSLFIINSTVSDNVSDAWGDGINILYSSPVIINSIIWNNNCNDSDCNEGLNNISVWWWGDPMYETTIIADNIIGGWNNPSWTSDCSNISISADPLFIDPQNGDYSLQGNSPCIDAGTAYFECDAEVILDIDSSEYCGAAPDMGVYEYITEDCEGSSLPGDLNDDGLLNVIDVVILVNIVLGVSEPVDAGDLNGDGIINILDVVMLVNIILGN